MVQTTKLAAPTARTADPAALADDAADARLAAEGDLRAFERIYRRHTARIHTLARRMIGREDADEATQDVFVRAWEKLSSFRGEAAFGTWLYRLAVNALLARRAARARWNDRFVEDEDVLEMTAMRPVETELRLDFESAIEHLPEGARQVFVLYDVEGYRHEEIATLLGITSGTSKSQLHRARKLLRAHLEG
jgi:RNA polymerase sigma-70 factor (ECF subfamily)